MPADEVDNWPRVVQLGWVVATDAGAEVRTRSHVVRPDGWTISPANSAVHGITAEAAAAGGVPIATVLELFRLELGPASLIVAHNQRFDVGCIGAEYHRLGSGYANPLSGMAGVCTMGWGRAVCRIPSSKPEGGYKRPSLAELYRHLFGEELVGAHDALVDARATARCFARMVELSDQTADQAAS